MRNRRLHPGDAALFLASIAGVAGNLHAAFRAVRDIRRLKAKHRNGGTLIAGRLLVQASWLRAIQAAILSVSAVRRITHPERSDRGLLLTVIAIDALKFLASERARLDAEYAERARVAAELFRAPEPADMDTSETT